MRQVKILFFSDAEREGGAEKYLVSVASRLPRHRFLAQAVCAADASMNGFAMELESAGIRVYRLPRVDTLRDFYGLVRLWIFFLVHRFEILHFNLTHPRACNAAMVCAALAGQRGILVTDHLPHVTYDGGKVPLRHRLAAGWLRRTIVVADAQKEFLCVRGVSAEKISVIHNGIDTESITPGDRIEEKRKELGLGEERIVGMVGRLTEQKGYPVFLHAAAWVKERFSPVRFLVIGGGEEEAGLKKMAAELGLEQHALFLGNRGDVPDLLSILDVSVLTSRFEGLPFTILESMAAARPVVATDIEGMREVVEDNVTGILVPPEDSKAAGEAILRLLQNPDEAKQMGLSARTRVEEQFSLEQMIKQTVEVYEQFLSRKNN